MLVPIFKGIKSTLTHQGIALLLTSTSMTIHKILLNLKHVTKILDDIVHHIVSNIPKKNINSHDTKCNNIAVTPTKQKNNINNNEHNAQRLSGK